MARREGGRGLAGHETGRPGRITSLDVAHVAEDVDARDEARLPRRARVRACARAIAKGGVVEGHPGDESQVAMTMVIVLRGGLAYLDGIRCGAPAAARGSWLAQGVPYDTRDSRRGTAL